MSNASELLARPTDQARFKGLAVESYIFLFHPIPNEQWSETNVNSKREPPYIFCLKNEFLPNPGDSHIIEVLDSHKVKRIDIDNMQIDKRLLGLFRKSGLFGDETHVTTGDVLRVETDTSVTLRPFGKIDYMDLRRFIRIIPKQRIERPNLIYGCYLKLINLSTPAGTSPQGIFGLTEQYYIIVGERKEQGFTPDDSSKNIWQVEKYHEQITPSEISSRVIPVLDINRNVLNNVHNKSNINVAVKILESEARTRCVRDPSEGPWARWLPER